MAAVERILFKAKPNTQGQKRANQHILHRCLLGWCTINQLHPQLRNYLFVFSQFSKSFGSVRWLITFVTWQGKIFTSCFIIKQSKAMLLETVRRSNESVWKKQIAKTLHKSQVIIWFGGIARSWRSTMAHQMTKGFEMRLTWSRIWKRRHFKLLKCSPLHCNTQLTKLLLAQLGYVYETFIPYKRLEI